MDYYEEQANKLKATDIRAARKVFSRVGFAFFMLVVISVLTQLADMSILKMAFPGGLNSQLLIHTAILIPMYLIAAFVCIIFLRQIEPQPVKQNSLTFGYFLALLLMCIPIMFAGEYLGIKLTKLLADKTGFTSSESLTTFVLGSDLLSTFIIIGLVAPIIEELLFRKFLIDRIVKYGEGIAVFVSALMFGLYHGNITQFFSAFGLGLMFSFVYCRTGKIRYSIAIHMIINTLVVVLAPLIISKIDLGMWLRFSKMEADDPKATALLEDIRPGAIALMIYVCVLLILGLIGLVLLIITRKRFALEKAELPIPERKRFLTVWMNFGMFLFIVVSIGLFVYNSLLP